MDSFNGIDIHYELTIYLKKLSGCITAIMTSVFLSLIGFYLINSGVKKDIESKVGQIIGTTPISNFKYLFAKGLSNFIVLLTIVVTVLLMSIILFAVYNDGYTFEALQFIKPYVLITIPALFFIAMLAVVFEVLFGKYSVIQNISFFFLFCVLNLYTPKTETDYIYDAFGSKIVMFEIEKTVNKITNSKSNNNFSMGYVINSGTKTKKFSFNGINFPTSFILSRLVWILLSVLIIGLISFNFHRFDRKIYIKVKQLTSTLKKQSEVKELLLSHLEKPQINYSILPLLKAEFLMLIRKGPKWLWLVNGIGMVLLAVLPLKNSHQLVLPILWFLQVNRLSDLASKALTNNVHFFTFTSFKSISRLFLSQFITSITLLLLLASPLIIRLSIFLNFTGALSIVFGGIFIVTLAALFGLLTKRKKLFEVLFFMLTYANINNIVFLDYFGALKHHTLYEIQQVCSTIILLSLCFLIRTYQFRK